MERGARGGEGQAPRERLIEHDAQRVPIRRRTEGEARDKLRALEDEARRSEDELRDRAERTSAELDELYGVVREHSDALLAHLRDVPTARGLISWMNPVARSA